MAYNRYMNGMSNGGNIFWDGATPLSNGELQRAVPSLFATEGHESRSDRFVPIPTAHVLEGLRAADFMPVMAQQARTRIPGKQDYTRHMIRMRHRSLTNTAGEAFEVILVNANDGTAAYKMIAGIFRFVCTNGLFTGEAFDTVTVRHAGKTVIDDVRNGALNMLQTAPHVLEHVERFKGITLDRAEALTFAEAAHRVRFASAYEADSNNPDALPVLNPDACPVQPLDLLRARRTSDKTPTLWSAFNIVQENTVRGGTTGNHSRHQWQSTPRKGARSQGHCANHGAKPSPLGPDRKNGGYQMRHLNDKPRRGTIRAGIAFVVLTYALLVIGLAL